VHLVEDAHRTLAFPVPPAGGGPVDLTALSACLPVRRLHGLHGPVAISAVAVHTDAVRPGALFACLPGAAQDGHDWAAVAVERGAVALLVERRLPHLAGIPQVEVPDARAGVALVAAAFHGRPDRRLLVLGVTGTNGKTTTAFMLHAVFGAAHRPLGLLGTVTYRLGRREVPAPLTTPEAPTLHALLAEMAGAGLQGVAMEASSHALSQGRLEGVEVDTAIFTNLSRDHLDYHGSAMAYFAAKRLLFRPRGGHKPFPALAVVCTDNAAGRLLAREAQSCRQVVTFGLDQPADVWGRYRADGAGSGTLSVRGLWGRGEVSLPLPGRHNAQNALGALAAACANGVPFDTVAHALATMNGVPGRFEPIEAGQRFAVVVDFAHNPDGLRWALVAARRRCGGRLRLVFGCKGGDGDQEKRRRMGALAGRLADVVYLTTDDPYQEDPEQIAAAVQGGLAPTAALYHVVLDRPTAIRQAIGDAHPGDLVLVAGRGHEVRQAVVGGHRPLDDRAVCRAALLQRLGTPSGADLALAAHTPSG